MPAADPNMSTSAEPPCRRTAHGRAIGAPIAAHGLALVLPLGTTVFLSTGPHPATTALLWTIPVWSFIMLDFLGPSDRRRLATELPAWPFEVGLYLLAAVQILNIALMVRMAARMAWGDSGEVLASVCDLLAIRILVGTNSCCSGIAVAHELIHRRRALSRLLGRALLLTVCYGHFAVEHLRSHHRLVGTRDDPATAHWGESYRSYWRRTKWAQLKSAWRLENQRLGLDSRFPLDWRLLGNEVLLGIVAEAMLLLLVFHSGGPAALSIFLLQALAAVRLLEAVNYFQHWGLERARDGLAAWVTDSWFTQYSFIGLARHADHHRAPHKPYYRLDHCDGGPKLPYGYFGMALLAKSFNPRFQRIAVAELRRYRSASVRTAKPAHPSPVEDPDLAVPARRLSRSDRSSGVFTLTNSSGRSL